MRDRRRVEAIGNSTEVFEEVIVIKELKWIFFWKFLDVERLRGCDCREEEGVKKEVWRYSPEID